MAIDTVLNSCYMDDCLDSVETEQKAVQLYEELTQLWQYANMDDTKWCSNSKKVLEKNSRGKKSKRNQFWRRFKKLGLRWDSEFDQFKFKAIDTQTIVTKI